MSSPAVPMQTIPVSRPRTVDFFLIFCGVAVSLLLGEWSGMKTVPPAGSADVALLAFAKVHPYLFFLPLGILLFWPLFYLTQRIVGRQQPLSAGEWLWGLAWMADLVVIGWIVWQAFGTPPDVKRAMITGYIIFVATAAALAVVIALVDVVGRWPQPWTHHFCVVLMIWSALPVGLMWLLKLKLE